MENVYYNPAAFGLTIVSSLDEFDLVYEYNTLFVVQHDATGRLFWAADSGCSCPTPFEEYHFRYSPESGIIDTDMSEIQEGSLDTFECAVNDFPVSIAERQKCLTTVKNLLKN